MEHLPALLASLAGTALNHALTKTLPPSAQSSGTSPTSESNSVDDKLAVFRPLPDPALPPSPSSPTSSAPGLILPFQFLVHKYTGDQKFISNTITSFSDIKTLCSPYRLAQFVELELYVAPSMDAMSIAGTITASWTPDYLVPDLYNLMAVYGAQTITFGGSYHTGAFTVPCDLKSVNPLAKSPLTFSDIPRINFNCFLQKDATKVGNKILAFIYLRGKVLCSYPSLTLGTGSSS